VSMLKYWLWLTRCRGLTNQTRLALLEHFLTPEAIYYADPGEVLLTDGITREQAETLRNKDLGEADRILGACAEQNLRILTMGDAEYPVRLRSIYDPPCVLYLRGRLPTMDEEPAIAVVGTREATPYGLRTAEQMGFGLAEAGAVVVTGLARGIDSAAAQGALRAGGTPVGVLGCGIDVVYPKENRWLYEDVAAAGALVSEYPPGTEPSASHFPARNRIMSGLSVAVLVVEAPPHSGALITAGAALEQGRDVFAVPGQIDAENSWGCNRLIREGAGLAAEPWDILREYAEAFPGKLKTPERRAPEPLGELPRDRDEAQPMKPTLRLSEAGLTDDQTALLRILGDEPMLVDDLIEATQLPARRVLSALTMLEVDGYAVPCGGKRYAGGVTLIES